MEFDKLLNMLQELLSEKGWQTPSQDGTYQDEPILRPAAKIARPKAAKFRELRQIQRSPEAYWRSGDWLFYQQAKCMEDYTETGDSDISFTWASSTHASYASYATLTDKQLTAYFIWRTKVRQGNYPFAIPAFIAIYAFELLNQIGVSDSMDGLQKLQALKNAYCHETDDFLAYPQREFGCHADAAALGRAHTGGTVRHPVRLRLLRTQPLQVLPSLSGGRADGHLPHFSGAVAVLRKVPEKRSVSCTFSKKGA